MGGNFVLSVKCCAMNLEVEKCCNWKEEGYFVILELMTFGMLGLLWFCKSCKVGIQLLSWPVIDCLLCSTYLNNGLMVPYFTWVEIMIIRCLHEYSLDFSRCLCMFSLKKKKIIWYLYVISLMQSKLILFVNVRL